MRIRNILAGLFLLITSQGVLAETWSMMVMLDSPDVSKASLPAATQSFITGSREDCEQTAISIIGQYQALLLKFHGADAVKNSRHAHSCMPIRASSPAAAPESLPPSALVL